MPKSKPKTKKKSRALPSKDIVQLPSAFNAGVKVPPGRPLKFASAEDMVAKANAYFKSVLKKKKEPITITGLCMALGTFRNVLMDYENGVYDKRDPEFSNAVKTVK